MKTDLSIISIFEDAELKFNNHVILDLLQKIKKNLFITDGYVES